VATYRYAAKNAKGGTVEGTIQAPTRNEAVAELRRQSLIVLKVEEGGRAGGKQKGGGKASGEIRLFKARPSANSTELVLFTRQLATMIGAGLSLMESLDVLADQAERPGFRMACRKLADELRGGSDLSAAMETMPRVFTTLYVSMVCAGEASGQMDIILERLAEYLEASAALKREIRAAMTYPVISLVLVLSITAFLMLGVVPTFRQVFESLESDLPPITAFVLNLSEWLRTKWFLVIGIAGGIVGAFYVFKRTPKGEYLWHRFTLVAPVFGPLVKKIALARFSRTFATLIRSGVPIMGTLDIVAATSGNRVISAAVLESKESVKGGNMLSEPLAKEKVFPPMVVRMIAIGERSGALEVLLEKIAEFYDAQVKAAIKSLTSLIEPLLIAFMGIIVGGVVMAVFLPILDIVGKLSQS
jgi:type IV pilus assembly protein PilC